MANTPRLAVRAEQEVLDRLDRLALAMPHQGINTTRSDAARACLLHGLDALEVEYGVAKKGGKKPRPGKA